MTMKYNWTEIEYGHFFGCWEPDDTSVCDELIEFFHSCENIERMSGTVYNNQAAKAVIDKTQKNSTDLSVPTQYMHPTINKYREFLRETFRLYAEKFPAADGTAPWNLTEPFNIQHYAPGGGFFSWHTERSGPGHPAVYRHLVFMTYLNDVEKGGETEFYHQQVKIKPRKGHTLIWPSDWTYRHRGIAAPKEDKYIATGWLDFV